MNENQFAVVKEYESTKPTSFGTENYNEKVIKNCRDEFFLTIENRGVYNIEFPNFANN